MRREERNEQLTGTKAVVIESGEEMLLDPSRRYLRRIG